MEKFLPGICDGDTLGYLINHKLQAPRIYKAGMNQAVDSIVRHMQSVPGYCIKETVKSGSQGKGTTAGNTADVDLVIFLNGYETMEELIAAKPRIIADISTHMNKFDRSVFSACIKVRENEYLGQYRLKHITMNRFVEVDILPAIDIVAQLGGSVDSVLEEMRIKSREVRGHYSVCFCKEQLMIKSKPTKVKDLIRLVKYWKNSNNLPIGSYCCEVVCLCVHDTFPPQQQTKFNMKEGFNRVLKFLIDTETPHTVIDPKYYYNTRDWFAVFPTLKEGAIVRKVAKQTVEALGSVPNKRKKTRRIKKDKNRQLA